ncbi:tumor necrosis factor receptor superfamily member 4 isoform X2 [Electrophorus electricus]|uniref:tumor necrosis factor receptor superfamily member 4 isoform X2 n=1 Tax=Electrophorus electricus TaxID=8005 RepID=UPI0015D0C3E7|nr:tumor necrosis factor receptor superfamily member 4 isoform X2 [Electrophorus electricus]
MLWHTFQFLSGFSFVFWLLMFHQANAEIVCEPGNKVTMKRDKCEPCGENQYRPSRGSFAECLNCSPCARYSELASPCTPTKNTLCHCRKGFKYVSGMCVCDKGSGLQKSEVDICMKCEYGTFTNTSDSTCQPWSKCDQSGEKIPGNNTADVVCKNATKPEVTTVTSSVTSIIFVPQMSTNTSVAWTTPSNPLTDTTSAHPNSKKYGLWLGPLGALLALVFIQFVIIQMKPTNCFHKKKQQIILQDSTCRKPVEESGEKFLLPFV